MAGAASLGFTLAFSLLAVFVCAFRREAGEKWGAYLACGALGGTAVASVLLMAAIFQNDFGLEYVANYSSKDLDPLYKFSVFWAGQPPRLPWTGFAATAAMGKGSRRDILPARTAGPRQSFRK